MQAPSLCLAPAVHLAQSRPGPTWWNSRAQPLRGAFPVLGRHHAASGSFGLGSGHACDSAPTHMLTFQVHPAVSCSLPKWPPAVPIRHHLNVWAGVLFLVTGLRIFP